MVRPGMRRRVRTSRQQHPHDVGVVLLGGQVQRRTRVVVEGVHGHPGVQQPDYFSRVPVPGRPNQFVRSLHSRIIPARLKLRGPSVSTFLTIGVLSVMM
ncbi:hypothetical protein RKD44_003606 [Streptomyces collinus]